MLDRAVRRLRQLCSSLLLRCYPRLTQPPLNLDVDEMLSAVVERLIKALREARPTTVRQFFALACQHMRWELNDLARRLEKQPTVDVLCDEQVIAPASSDSGISPETRRILDAIDGLSAEEREVFDLIRIQGITQPEAAEIHGVSVMTVRRSLSPGVQRLTELLGDIRPVGRLSDSP
jgi:RNA polymerase sigma factor (sigma-70 family)